MQAMLHRLSDLTILRYLLASVGALAVDMGSFLGLMALVQPPIVFWVDTHLGSGWVLGMPFLYVYLGAVYFLLIGVLLWALRRAV